MHERIKQKSRASTNNDLKNLKRFFRDFLSRPDVVESFRFPRSPFKPKVVLSKTDLQLAYKAIDSDVGRALFLFYASTGLKHSEVLGLTVNEVNLKKRMVVPDCHSGTSKHSYVSFYDEEAEDALKKVVTQSRKLFQISDRQFRKIWGKTFDTACMILLMGAIIPLVGEILKFVAWILAAVGFFSLKTPTQKPLAPSALIALPSISTEEKRFCRYCGT